VSRVVVVRRSVVEPGTFRRGDPGTGRALLKAACRVI
jgi:hypothetical protein